LVILTCASRSLIQSVENHLEQDTTVTIQVHALKQDTGHVGNGKQ